MTAQPAYAEDGTEIDGWIGVDLDGTLAEYHGWVAPEIGNPVEAMCARVRAWRADGHDIRIVTARVAVLDPLRRAAQIDRVQKWCAEHLGEVLPITCAKDLAMVELWDDRAVTVEPNTGRVICHPAGGTPRPTSLEMALEFHRALDLPVADRPINLTQDRRRLRLTLLGEEVGELVAAEVGLDDRQTETLKNDLARRFLHEETTNYCPRRIDTAAIAKEACDVHVVISGDMAERGIPEDDVYAVVHKSNLAKAGGPRRPDGKQLKPASWCPPDVVAAITAATEAAR